MKLVSFLVVAIFGFNHGSAEQKEKSQPIPPSIESFTKLHRQPEIVYNKTNRADAVSTGWIEQKLDHFNESETRTWQMRYLINDAHFQSGGPIFIVVGGEWTISDNLITLGHFYDMAVENNAIMFYTEHRFFGESSPFSETTVDNMYYMEIRQALADLAHFIEYKRATDPTLTNSKVIIQGCSYAGDMVVWFKRMYPDLVAGGWALSAPVLAIVDYYEFKEVKGKAMAELGSQQCYNRIQNGIAEMEYMLEHKRGAEIKAMLKICNNFDEYNDLDAWTLLNTLTNIFTLMVQLQREGAIPLYCQYIMQFDDDLTAMANLFMDVFGHPNTCSDLTYKSLISVFSNMDTSNEVRTKHFQLCDQFGWFPTTTSKKQPFGTKVPLTLFTSICRDAFGEKYTYAYISERVERTNTLFGGKKPEVENVYMTQGGMDPWLPAGLGEEDGATAIPRAAHCVDLDSISTFDSPEMRASKERIAELVRGWLAQ